MLNFSGGFDPMPTLDPEVSDLLADPSRLFPSDTGPAATILDVPRSERRTYAGVVLKGLRRGKFALAPKAMAGRGSVWTSQAG